MKILLLRSIHTEDGEKAPNKDICRYRQIGESLALGYIASALINDGNIVEILDGVLQNISNEEIINKIDNGTYDVICFSSSVYLEIKNSTKIIESCKSLKNTFVVMGGHAATLADVQILKNNEKIDCIVRFEGEKPIAELINKLKNGQNWRNISSISYINDGEVIKTNSEVDKNFNLDNLHFPKRYALGSFPDKTSLVNICTSRGCYGICSFCSVSAFYKRHKCRWNGRSPENVISEIESIVNLYNRKNFLFVDDNFIGPGKSGYNRANKIADLLIEKNLDIKYATNFRANDVVNCESLLGKLKKSGLTYVFLGTESGSQQQLDFFNKNIKVEINRDAVNLLIKNNIAVTEGFIPFDYRISIPELKKNLQYARETKGITNARKLYSNLIIYHGTKLFENCCCNINSFDEPVLKDFKDKTIDRSYKIIVNTLSKGEHIYDLIDDMFWYCAFKYNIEIPKKLYDFNYNVNDRLISFMENVLDHAVMGEYTDILEIETIEYITGLLNPINEMQNYFDKITKIIKS